jgi:hypothetical protein
MDRVPLLFNSDIAMLYVEPDVIDAHFYRNSQADEVVYVAKGRGARVGVRRAAVSQRRLRGDPPQHHAPLAPRSVEAGARSCS